MSVVLKGWPKMILRELIETLGLKLVAGETGLGREVSSGYVGDLLSCVMAGAAPGALWVTVQGHPNIVAVAVLVGVAGVVVTEGGRVEPATIEKANHEGIPLMVSQKQSFDVVAGLACLGVGGTRC